jgi:hypothetical protein
MITQTRSLNGSFASEAWHVLNLKAEQPVSEEIHDAGWSQDMHAASTENEKVHCSV